MGCFCLETRKLIILGNGFDLACGLKSKYADFFEKRISKDLNDCLMDAYKIFNIKNIDDRSIQFATIYDTRLNYVKNQGQIPSGMKFLYLSETNREVLAKSDLTFWDIVLFYFQINAQGDVYDVDWRDVENRMLNFLNDTDLYKPSLANILETIKNYEDLDPINWTCLYLAEILSEGKIIPADFIEYLYKELLLFESVFIDFLKEEVNSNKDYDNNAFELLLNIVSVDELGTLLEQKYLSFNYTEPIDSPYFNMTNVHGTLKSNHIIFGIDQTKVDPSDDIYRFTKTFRQMTETSISKRSEELILPRKEEINEIAFFGHSLSPLDYSYFQTIFDFYDLYSSDVILVFYYSLYEGATKLDMELDLSKKISQMLNNYGPSIGNENKADNLMHKLLLEKRLIIEEIS